MTNKNIAQQLDINTPLRTSNSLGKPLKNFKTKSDRIKKSGVYKFNWVPVQKHKLKEHLDILKLVQKNM